MPTTSNYTSFLKENNIILDKSIDLAWLELHGGNSINGHTVTLKKGIDCHTNSLIKETFKRYFMDKPCKIVLTSCYGSNALNDSIQLLPIDSEMVALSKAATTQDEEAINMSSGLSTMLQKTIEERRDPNNKLILDVPTITVLATYVGAVPTYVKKTGDDRAIKILCDKEESIENLDTKTLRKFYRQICGNKSDPRSKLLGIQEGRLEKR